MPLGGAELAAEIGAVSADHLLHASDDGMRRMAGRRGRRDPPPATTAFSLREPYARGRSMIDAGCAVALATDFNPGSCFCGVDPARRGARGPLHAAHARGDRHGADPQRRRRLGRAERIGSLEPGKQGDLVILEHPSYRFIPYHIGVSTVEKVIKRGGVVFDNLNHGGTRC